MNVNFNIDEECPRCRKVKAKLKRLERDGFKSYSKFTKDRTIFILLPEISVIRNAKGKHEINYYHLDTRKESKL